MLIARLDILMRFLLLSPTQSLRRKGAEVPLSDVPDHWTLSDPDSPKERKAWQANCLSLGG